MTEPDKSSPDSGLNPNHTPCPTPEHWEELLGPESIMHSFDSRLADHVEHCPHCQNYLETRSSAPGIALLGMAQGAQDPPPERPLNLMGITMPPGYEAVGEPVYGGRGMVFKAIETATGRFVAMKMSKFRHGNNEAERKALENEAQAVSSLAHPNIVQVYEVLAAHNPPAIVMEWLEGGTLMDRLRNRQPTIPEIVGLMHQLADAVEHAHQHLVLHRDIKPSNILMSGPGYSSVKLGDFGLAKLGQPEDGWSTATEFIGTPVYMAPESFRKESGTIGPTVDIYSLGAIFYRLLSGKVPFEGANPIELGMRVVQEDVTPIRHFQKAVPKELEAICLKCLRKEPEERYQNAASLKADLVRYTEGKPIKAGRDGTLVRWRRWARRDPKAATQAAAFAGFLICVIIALASLLQRSRRSEQLAQQKLTESNQAIGLASPIFKRILKDFKLKSDEVDHIKQFIKIREDIAYEPVDLKDRLQHYYLTLELADSLRKIPGELPNSIELAKLSRAKIGRFIEEHGEEASKILTHPPRNDGFKQTVLEKALIQYSYACSQLHGTYGVKEQIGLGVPDPPEDPEMQLIKEAIAAAQRVVKLNPVLSEPLGQIANYNVMMAEYEIYKGNRNNAINYLIESLNYSGFLREEFPGALERWTTDLSTRRILAQAYLEPPASLPDFLTTMHTLELTSESEKLRNHQFEAELRSLIWLESNSRYMALVSFGEFQKALGAIDRSIHNLPFFRENNQYSSQIRHSSNLMKIDRLSLLKLMKTEPGLLEKSQAEVELMIDNIANPIEKALAHAYYALFRPDPQKRDPIAAQNWLDQIKDQDAEILMLKNVCNLMRGQGEISDTFEAPENLAKRRSSGGFLQFHKIVFEAESLIRQGRNQAAAERMKSVEAWLENDKLVPCVIRLRAEEIRAALGQAKQAPPKAD